jgi:hypothetical protein
MTENTKPGPGQPTVLFRQLVKVSAEVSLDALLSADTLLGLSDEGAIYRREYSENADLTIWRRLYTVSSTDLEVRPCSYPECEYLIEKLPEDWEPIAKPSCERHRYRV